MAKGIASAIAIALAGMGSQGFAERDERIELKAERQAVSASASPEVYGSLELRHYSNTFYDDADYYQRQEPSMHVRGRLGTLLYGGKVDAYATLGFIKVPETRKVIQKRPEIEVDYYPIVGPYGQIVQYNLVQLPFDEAEYDEDNRRVERQGVVYTVGLAPTLAFPMDIGGSGFTLKTGFDVWTELFSRRKYVEPGEETGSDEGYFLRKAQEGEPVEDYAPHYFSQYMVGFSLSPEFFRKMTMDASIHYDSEFHPKYSEVDEKVDYRYGAERSSYYRLRLHYAITDRLAFSNEFYHFHRGFFNAKRKGEDERRYRNIAQLTCKL